MDLGSVRVKIEGDPTKLQADLKAAEAAAANAGGKIAQAFNKSAGSINDTTTATQKAVSGITQTGEAAEKAGKKVQSFVGAIPGMGVAAERFIGLVPGLGAGLLAIFPVLGAFAFAEGLGRVATSIGNAIDEAIGLKKAMEQLADATKEADSAIASLGKTVDSINVDRMTEQFGKASGLKLKAGLGAAEAQADFVKARALYASIDQLKKEFELNNAVNPGVLIPGVRGDIYAQQKATLDKLQNDAIAADARGKERLLRAQKDLDDSETEKVKAGKEALKKQNEGWENRYRLFETELAETKAIRDSQLKATADFNQKMLDLSEQGAKDLAEQQQRWKKINIDAAAPEKFQQVKIDEPFMNRIATPLANKIDLNKAGIKTTDQREREIANDQEMLSMAESINVPLGTQLRMREQILQQQIDLKAAQGQSVSAELQALDALQAQMDRMHQKAAGIAPLLHNLRGIGGQIPGQLGGALAGGIMGGNPGKNIGQEIRGALQGIGQQILGTIFQRAIEQLVVSLGLNTLANTVLQALFPVQQGSTAALIGALALNTAAVTAQATTTGVGAGVGAAGAAAGIARSVGSAASGGLLGGVISGVISAAGSLVSAFLIIRAIHGTTAEVRALRKSGGIKPGGGGISGADAEKPAQAGYMSSLAKIFGADAVRVNVVAVSPLAFTNGLFSVLGNLFGFADGGRPPLGRPSIVGERGPELFIPDQAGRIMPNGGSGLSFPVASSNGGGINIGSITANGVNNPREFVREVARQLPAYLKSTNPKYSPASR